MSRARGENHGVHDGLPFESVPLFIAAAHELKSPLALMRQLALSIESGTCDANTAAKIAHQISLTSERAIRLTTDLTKSVRLEDSLFNLEPLNPLSLCEEVVEELQPLYRAKGRVLYLEQRRHSLLGIANKDLLRRILLNFVDNALHYTTSDTPVVVTATARNRGSTIRLGVRDHGPAMPANVWRRLETTLGSPQPMHFRPNSSGLGIYIAQQFADVMNADVGAIRHRDGATFYVDIAASTQMRLL